MWIEYLQGNLTEFLVNLRFSLHPFYYFFLLESPNCSSNFFLSFWFTEGFLIVWVLPAAENASYDVDCQSTSYTYRSKYLKGSDGCTQVPPDTQGNACDNEKHGQAKEALSHCPQSGLPQSVKTATERIAWWPGCMVGDLWRQHAGHSI